jgi:hypothetical protein
MAWVPHPCRVFVLAARVGNLNLQSVLFIRNGVEGNLLLIFCCKVENHQSR